MPATTIRLSEDLKAHISSAAERTGSTTHSFILEAIAEKAEQAERIAEFQDEAFQRYEKMIDSGKAIPWNTMKEYLIRGRGIVTYRFQLSLGDAQSARPARHEKGE